MPVPNGIADQYGEQVDAPAGLKFMQLTLIREIYLEHCTLGKLYKDGGFFCYTLEDTARPAWVKIPGKTCIPEGGYSVWNTYSNRFKKVLPQIQNVPMFTGIRFHGGNTEANTEGCILIGAQRDNDKIYDCHAVVEALTDFVGKAPVTWLEVKHNEFKL